MVPQPMRIASAATEGTRAKIGMDHQGPRRRALAAPAGATTAKQIGRSVASPDEGHQAPGTRLVCPVRIAEMVNKHLLFGTDPVRVHRYQHQRRQGCDEPVDGESASCPYENRADVSRMADEAVWATLDDDLSISGSQRAGVVLAESAHRPNTNAEADDADGDSNPRQRRVRACHTDSRHIEKERCEERDDVRDHDQSRGRPICLSTLPAARVVTLSKKDLQQEPCAKQ